MTSFFPGAWRHFNWQAYARFEEVKQVLKLQDKTVISLQIQIVAKERRVKELEEQLFALEDASSPISSNIHAPGSSNRKRMNGSGGSRIHPNGEMGHRPTPRPPLERTDANTEHYAGGAGAGVGATSGGVGHGNKPKKRPRLSGSSLENILLPGFDADLYVAHALRASSCAFMLRGACCVLCAVC